jgi:hypothetical protein
MRLTRLMVLNGEQPSNLAIAARRCGIVGGCHRVYRQWSHYLHGTALALTTNRRAQTARGLRPDCVDAIRLFLQMSTSLEDLDPRYLWASCRWRLWRQCRIVIGSWTSIMSRRALGIFESLIKRLSIFVSPWWLGQNPELLVRFCWTTDGHLPTSSSTVPSCPIHRLCSRSRSQVGGAKCKARQEWGRP